MNHFVSYSAVVRIEMIKRGYRTMDKVWEKIVSVCNKDVAFLLPFDEIYEDWMNDEYFIICYYNLKEKWMCDGIKDEDWFKICERNVIRNKNGW